MTKLEGKLRTSMYQIVDGMERKLDRIYRLSAELGFGRIVAQVGTRSCELLEYLLEKQASNPSNELQYVHFERKEAWPVYLLPTIERVIESCKPYAKCVDEDGSFIDPSSKDLIVDPSLQWFAFLIYDETHQRRKSGWQVVVYDDKATVDILEVDRFYQRDEVG
jgi:hypothetical protein